MEPREAHKILDSLFLSGNIEEFKEALKVVVGYHFGDAEEPTFDKLNELMELDRPKELTKADKRRRLEKQLKKLPELVYKDV